MTNASHRWQELDSVLDRVLDDIHDDEDVRRLNEILRTDVEACRRYVGYLELHGRLAWGDGLTTECDRETDISAPFEIAESANLVDSAVQRPRQQSCPVPRRGGEIDDPPASVPIAPIVIQTLSDLPVSYSPLGSFLFSYAVAAVTLGIGLLIGWAYQLSVYPRQVAHENVARPAPAMVARTSEMVFVGRITGMFDCQWAEPSTAAADYAYVPLGRRYALVSGLMEISYDTGANVILQGPCMYEVESRTGGYLAVGRLTARVEKRGEGRGERGEGRRETGENVANQLSTIGNHQHRSPLSSLPSPLFTVRTPTAIITDLGTEFGVEVDRSGASQAHVFRGKVEMRAAGGGNAKAVSLEADESARVDFGKDQAARVVRQTSPKNTFVREMPKSVPIVVFNTGVGLKAGDPDPHWQIVARSDDPKFKPRPAVVRGLRDDFFLEDDPNRSQWISLVGGDAEFPQEVVYVFRTTFDLTGTSPSGAVLRGRFLADDRVVAVRLNGRRSSVPVQREGGPFVDWTSFRIVTGFVKGMNVLEIDVLNSDPFQSPSQRRTTLSRMSCRVELEGVVTRDPKLSGDEVSGKRLQTPVQDGKTAATEPKKPEQKVVVERGRKELPLIGTR